MHFEKEYKFENKIRGAVFLMVAVMPTFVGMLESSGVQLLVTLFIKLN